MSKGLESLADILKRMDLPVVDRTALEQEDAIASVRAALWRRFCMLGQCRYATPETRHEPKAADATSVCGGYEGFRHTHETGEPYWRWRICSRHRDWAERRQRAGKTGEVPF